MVCVREREGTQKERKGDWKRKKEEQKEEVESTRIDTQSHISILKKKEKKKTALLFSLFMFFSDSHSFS